MKGKRIIFLGGAGFIGTNLACELSKNTNLSLTIVDKKMEYFNQMKGLLPPTTQYVVADFDDSVDFDSLVQGQDIVFHLASSNIPGNSNLKVPGELQANVIITAKLLDACVRQHTEKVIFISSGGAVYGKKCTCPVSEEMVTYPITSYGLQKVAIEKLLYLYRYQNGLDYRVIRLANLYGRFQRPNGKLGVVTTFVYKALMNQILDVYGDGTVVRDFIYIDDAVRGILQISFGSCHYRTFNLGSGIGTSVNQVIEVIKNTINPDAIVRYEASRKNDVPVNYLDISRYEKYYGRLNPIELNEGIKLTAHWLKDEYNL